MDKFYQVFVSSTFDDLKDERQQVTNTLAKAGYVAAGMELFPAADQQQLEYIKRVIDRSDYYVVIVGGRYGSLEHFPLNMQHIRSCGSSWRIHQAGRHREGRRCGSRGFPESARRPFVARL